MFFVVFLLAAWFLVKRLDQTFWVIVKVQKCKVLVRNERTHASKTIWSVNKEYLSVVFLKNFDP